MVNWLPSERRWIDGLAERVFDGEIVLARAVPRWGITAVCEALSDTLGESVVRVDGRLVTEENQKVFREELDSNIRAAINRTGVAQLLFDNYGRAIRRSQGGHLHSLLYRALVDSPTARDTGALLTARPNDMLDPGFAGSPLISRVRPLVLPALDHDDAELLGISLSDLRVLAGDSTWLARHLLDGGLRQGRVSAVEHLTHDRRRIVEALPPGAVNKLAGGTATSRLDVISREALMCFGCIGPTDEFEPATLVVESALIDEFRAQNPSWPASLDESVERFADLLAGAENAFWVDRWIFSRPSRTREFLDRLRVHTSARLRLLTSDDRDRGAFAQSIAAALEGIEDVEVRFMHWSDRRLLHDRHLALPALKTGYILPTANVVLAVDDPGNAVAARIPAVDYTPYWSRASRVFPAP